MVVDKEILIKFVKKGFRMWEGFDQIPIVISLFFPRGGHTELFANSLNVVINQGTSPFEMRKVNRNRKKRWTFRGAQIPDWGPEFSLCTMEALSGIRMQFLFFSDFNLPGTLSCLTRNSPRSSKKWSWWWFLRGWLVRFLKEDYLNNISMCKNFSDYYSY